MSEADKQKVRLDKILDNIEKKLLEIKEIVHGEKNE